MPPPSMPSREIQPVGERWGADSDVSGTFPTVKITFHKPDKKVNVAKYSYLFRKMQLYYLLYFYNK